jgi:hypothetical protein
MLGSLNQIHKLFNNILFRGDRVNISSLVDQIIYMSWFWFIGRLRSNIDIPFINNFHYFGFPLWFSGGSLFFSFWFGRPWLLGWGCFLLFLFCVFYLCIVLICSPILLVKVEALINLPLQKKISLLLLTCYLIFYVKKM